MLTCKHYLYHFILVDGGWREEPFSPCSEVCGEGLIRKLKYCDNPIPEGGNLCPCNSSNPYEVECDGRFAVIEEVCNDGPCQSKLASFHINICFWYIYSIDIKNFLIVPYIRFLFVRRVY